MYTAYPPTLPSVSLPLSAPSEADFSDARLALWVGCFALAAWATTFSPLNWGLTAWLLLGAPLVEELVFRSGLQSWLMKRGVASSTVWVALAFAAAHALRHPWAMAALITLPALVVGAVYTRTRRLGDCVALHGLFNAAWLMSISL